ncbi:hypothetical protein L6452_08845 [Arctium lappa]|uniref:Uncharacterized protein n=1 Tax=Arctium lappa TaxID=4217 RepID=A0ACB9DJF5_ARCLA|nr:hypothetical protein L6452_08845 [Arctium lappa]
MALLRSNSTNGREPILSPRALTSQTTTDPEPVRPLANFPPSIWADRFISFSLDNTTLEAYAKAVEELKEAVRSLIIDTTIDETTKLSLIYSVHRLGLSYLYSEEIDAQLDKLFKELDLKDYEEVDLYTISVQFQVFRHHGYRLSSDVFNKFKDNSTEGRTSNRISVVERYGISDLDAINRWEIGVVDQLPEYIKPFYRILLNEYDELEKEYTNEGRAYNVHASKQAV